MSVYKIFVVDDDPWYSQILEYHLSLNLDYEVTCFASGKECLKNLHLNPQLITIDYSMDDMTGDELLEKIRNWNTQIPVVVISGQEEISVALELLKKGAYDYLIKDDNTKDLLWNSIIRAREIQALRDEVNHLQEQLGEKFTFEKTIIGQSTAIKKTFKI